MNYSFLNNFLLSNITKFFPKTVTRKLLRKYKVFFVPTFFKSIPKSYYPIFTNIKDQLNIINNYKIKKKLIKNNSYIKLDNLLKKLFKKSFFDFLDVGGDSIDFYLVLTNKLKINKYYIYNFKEIVNIFFILKNKYNFQNLFPIYRIKKFNYNSFVYFGSSIQYFKNYKLLLKRIFHYKPKYIFFSGTTFFNKSKKNKDFLVVKQTNILPHTVYLYFFNLNRFVDYLNINGYKVVSINNNRSANINYENFSSYLNNTRYLDILFVRKKSNLK